MTPQEKDLIESVFERLAKAADAPKDPEALALIRDRLARQPDAVYGLVQAVLVQELALTQATAHIADLERQLSQSAHGGQSASGSFLSGLTAWSRGAPRPGPAYQAAPPPAPPPSSGPWGAPVGGQSYAQQPASPGPWGQSSGGGFLHNVASMAAGVAGGTLLADGIASLFGGGHHLFGGYGGGLYGGGLGGVGGAGPWGGGAPGEVVENFTTVNNYGDQGMPDPSQDPNLQDASYQDDGGQDSSFDDGSFDGGGFDSGFDSSDT